MVFIEISGNQQPKNIIILELQIIPQPGWEGPRDAIWPFQRLYDHKVGQSQYTVKEII